MRRSKGFLAGFLLSAAIFGVPAIAGNVGVECRPVALPPPPNCSPDFLFGKDSIPAECVRS